VRGLWAANAGDGVLAIICR